MLKKCIPPVKTNFVECFIYCLNVQKVYTARKNKILLCVLSGFKMFKKCMPPVKTKLC